MNTPRGTEERHIPLGRLVTREELDAHAATSHGGSSDGVAPTATPDPVLTAMPGALLVSWDPPVNADPTTVRVYVMED